MSRLFWVRGIACWLLFPGITAILFAQSETAGDGSHQGDSFWIFLTTDKSTEGIDRSEIAKMQEAHLVNFRNLHKAGKLLTAGPMADPEKKKRGIVVLTATDSKSLPSLFEPDPLVKQGFLAVDAIQMEIAVGSFSKDADPNKFAEYRLVVLEKTASEEKEIDDKTKLDNLSYCNSIHDPDRLCFAGWLNETKRSRRGVLIFRKLDDDKLKPLVDDLPAVKSSKWSATTFPLYMTDGIVK